MFKLDPRRVDTREPIARGSFGAIYAYLNDDGKENKDWVVKCIQFKETRELNFFTQELLLGFNHKHPCIVSNRGFNFQGSQQEGFNLFIKMPRMGPSLKRVIGDYCKAKAKPNLNDVTKCFYNAASGLEYLEHKRIIHNNVNPGTILFDQNGAARIGGIGLAQHKPWKEEQSSEGTRIYAAPERLDEDFVPQKETAFKGDVWSLGLTIIEFCLLNPKRYYPIQDEDDDWLQLDSDESKPKSQPQEEKKIDVDNLNLNKEEGKKRVIGSILVEENLQLIEKEYDRKLGDVEGPETTHKLVKILRELFNPNPKDRPSFSKIRERLNEEFPELVRKTILCECPYLTLI